MLEDGDGEEPLVEDVDGGWWGPTGSVRGHFVAQELGDSGSVARGPLGIFRIPASRPRAYFSLVVSEEGIVLTRARLAGAWRDAEGVRGLPRADGGEGCRAVFHVDEIRVLRVAAKNAKVDVQRFLAVGRWNDVTHRDERLNCFPLPCGDCVFFFEGRHGTFVLDPRDVVEKCLAKIAEDFSKARPLMNALVQASLLHRSADGAPRCWTLRPYCAQPLVIVRLGRCGWSVCRMR